MRRYFILIPAIALGITIGFLPKLLQQVVNSPAPKRTATRSPVHLPKRSNQTDSIAFAPTPPKTNTPKANTPFLSTDTDTTTHPDPQLTPPKSNAPPNNKSTSPAHTETHRSLTPNEQISSSERTTKPSVSTFSRPSQKTTPPPVKPSPATPALSNPSPQPSPPAISPTVEADTTIPNSPWLFDATRFTTPIDWKTHTVPRLQMVYAGQLGLSHGSERDNMPSEIVLRKKIEALPKSNLYCIDIERWPIAVLDDSLFDRNIERLGFILNLFRDIHPQAKLGYYGIFPRFSYFEAHRYPTPSNHQAFNMQAARNTRVQKLANQVDIIFPSLYAVRLGTGAPPTNAAWFSRARALIDTSRAYGKPAYAFLWSKMTHRDGFWRLQLQHTKELADAVVIWGGPGPWSPNSSWYQETLNYLDNPRPYHSPAGD